MSDDDRRAVELLYATHERGLYNVAYRYLWNAEDARDVVHDAFVRMWRRRESVDWPRAAGLAYRTVVGLALNRRRAAAVRRAITFWRDDAPAPDALLEAARVDAQTRAAIDALPERLRAVLLLTTFADLDQAEVAAALGIAVGTVASRRHEAIARLRVEVTREVG